MLDTIKTWASTQETRPEVIKLFSSEHEISTARITNRSAAGMQNTPPRDIFNVSYVNQGL